MYREEGGGGGDEGRERDPVKVKLISLPWLLNPHRPLCDCLLLPSLSSSVFTFPLSCLASFSPLSSNLSVFSPTLLS